MYDNPLKLIADHDLEALKKVKGIGDKIVQRIIRDFEDNKDLTGVYIELDKLGLTNNLIDKILAFYKSPDLAVKTVKRTPYDLIKIDGIGFNTADKIALKTGIEFNSIERIKAFIVYFLKLQGESGHSYITAKELNYNIFKTLGTPDELVVKYTEDYKTARGYETDNNVSQAIFELKEEKEINIEESENKSERRVYLTFYYNLEKKIAYHLKRILNGKNNFRIENFDEKIKMTEQIQGFEFTDEQIAGIKLGLKSQVCLITGLAGSGKTSLVTGILSVLNEYTFAQTALSGQAAARMQEVTGEDGKTIHRLLGYNPKLQEEFTYNEKNPLPYDIIILDEISLVGGSIFLSLLKAIPTGTKLYMLGDPGQLEAIGPLNLAADMIESKEIPTVELKKVHRQAQKSGILTTAYDIRNQIQIIDDYGFEGTEVRGELKDMVLEITQDKEEDSDLAIRYFKKYYESSLVNKDIMKIQAISPVKERGESCVFKLNNRIQNLVNPKTSYTNFINIKKKSEDKDLSFEIREGDKVMCIKNNYKALASRDMDSEITSSIFNGWKGLVTEINSIYTVVNFPLASVEEIIIPNKELGNYIMLGYCSTTHKIQGDSSEVVIGVIDYSTPPIMLTSQLVYTLITRAKMMCILIAQNTALRKAISTNFVSSKRTFLKEMLEKEEE